MKITKKEIIDNIKILKYLKSALSLYFKNNDGYNYIKDKINLQEALITVFSISLLSSVIGLLINPSSTTNLKPYHIFIIISGNIFGILIYSFLLFGIFHLILKALGGKNKFSQTIKFALSTYVLSSLIFLFFNFFPGVYTNKIFINGWINTTYNAIIGILFLTSTITLFIWWLSVNIKIFSKLHNLTKTKTTIATIISVLILATGSYIIQSII